MQPVEEGAFAEDADVGVLGGVDMGVYAFEGLSVFLDLIRHDESVLPAEKVPKLQCKRIIFLGSNGFHIVQKQDHDSHIVGILSLFPAQQKPEPSYERSKVDPKPERLHIREEIPKQNDVQKEYLF